MDGYKASFDKLWGYANVVRYGAHRMSEDGSIVLVSGAPARKTKPGQVAIGSVGGAVEALVRAVAPEITPRRLNVVAPGTIDTPMVALQGYERTALYTKMTKGNIIPRAGTADEVAGAIVFMVQNDFVTGTTIDIDGGWLLSLKRKSTRTDRDAWNVVDVSSFNVDGCPSPISNNALRTVNSFL